MANNILKEAIADAKAVREVALANAKAALEEAFTPKLQSMLSAKLSEELEDEELQEGEDMIDELFEMDKDMEEDMYDEDMYEDEEVDLSEEIDLEEILNELGIAEGVEKEGMCEECGTAHEGSCMEEELDKVGKEDDDIDNDGDSDKTDDYLANRRKAVSKAMKKESTKHFDLDLLLEKINALSIYESNQNVDNDPEVNLEIINDEIKSFLSEDDGSGDKTSPKKKPCPPESCPKPKVWNKKKCKCECKGGQKGCKPGYSWSPTQCKCVKSSSNTSPVEESYGCQDSINEVKRELTKTKSVLSTLKSELNEVNLLNSKLLYVNRIFKANTLDESQKLRVVETLDKAESTKEAKLIYETIKGTFNINPKKSIREGLGMASSAAGLSTARKPILNESNDMVTRMQKLANIKIKQ